MPMSAATERSITLVHNIYQDALRTSNSLRVPQELLSLGLPIGVALGKPGSRASPISSTRSRTAEGCTSTGHQDENGTETGSGHGPESGLGSAGPLVGLGKAVGSWGPVWPHCVRQEGWS